MELNRDLLNQAIQKNIINSQQADALWSFLSEHGNNSASFRAAHILYYFGGLIAIGAMSLFMTLGWESFGGWGLFFISLAYVGAGLWLAEYFLFQRKLIIPAGIMTAFVVTLTPLAVYALQKALGYWAIDRDYRDYHIYIDWRWILMEFATLISGAIILWRYRLPFSAMPVAVTLWYMSMDLVPFLFNQELTWELRQIVSVWFGLIIILVGFWIDIRTQSTKDFAFWLYLFGVLAFWGGLSSMHSDSNLNKFIYLCINLSMIIIGSALVRKVFVIFGGLGVAGYIGYYAYHVFKDSLIFPFALTVLGLIIIFIGIKWQNNEEAIAIWSRNLLPIALRKLIERRQG